MNRLRLLTTGNSLVGLKQSESHYRVMPERLLPKFGPAKNPFTPSNTPRPACPEADSRMVCATAPAQERVKVPQVPVRNSSGPTGVVTMKLPAILTDSNGSERKGGLQVRTETFAIKWAGKLRTFFSRTARMPAKVILSSPTKLAVQGELSLDSIKVVRNDLSDADLEIVPLKSPTARASASPALHLVERTAQGGMTWGRFSGIFGTGKR
jgi:hypothetical protein